MVSNDTRRKRLDSSRPSLSSNKSFETSKMRKLQTTLPPTSTSRKSLTCEFVLCVSCSEMRDFTSHFTRSHTLVNLVTLSDLPIVMPHVPELDYMSYIAYVLSHFTRSSLRVVLIEGIVVQIRDLRAFERRHEGAFGPSQSVCRCALCSTRR